MNTYLRVEKNGPIAVVRMCKPPANALDIAMLDEIDATFSALEEDKDVGAIVLTGEGKFFSAGMDLKTTPEADRKQQDETIMAINRGFGRVILSPKAEEYLAIPRDGYAKVKQQLHRPAYAEIHAAIDERKDPALGNWFSDEAKSAAAAVLAKTS